MEGSGLGAQETVSSEGTCTAIDPATLLLFQSHAEFRQGKALADSGAGQEEGMEGWRETSKCLRMALKTLRRAMHLAPDRLDITYNIALTLNDISVGIFQAEPSERSVQVREMRRRGCVGVCGGGGAVQVCGGDAGERDIMFTLLAWVCVCCS